MSDTDTVPPLARFVWAGRPTRQPLRIALTGQLIRHPDTDPFQVDGIDVPTIVDVADEAQAAAMRSTATWTEVDADGQPLDTPTDPLVAVVGVSAELAATIRDQVPDGAEFTLDTLTGVDGVGHKTAEKIVAFLTDQES